MEINSLLITNYTPLIILSMCMAAGQSHQIPLQERALFDTILYGFKVTVLSDTTLFNTTVWILLPYYLSITILIALFTSPPSILL